MGRALKFATTAANLAEKQAENQNMLDGSKPANEKAAKNIARRQLRVSTLALRQKQYEQAASAAERATQLDPESGSAFFRLAQASQKLGDSGRAKAAIDTARRLSPKNEKVLALHTRLETAS